MTKDKTAKKPGRIRRGAKSVWNFYRPNFKSSFTRLTDDGGLGKSIKSSYRNFFWNIRKRFTDPGTFPDSFESLQQLWGVNDDEIPKVVRGMQIQATLFAVFLVLMVLALFNALYQQQVLYAVVYALIGSGFAFAVMVFRWRIHVLKSRTAVSFRQWLGR